jgi:hypothetical protein
VGAERLLEAGRGGVEHELPADGEVGAGEGGAAFGGAGEGGRRIAGDLVDEVQRQRVGGGDGSPTSRARRIGAAPAPCRASR